MKIFKSVKAKVLLVIVISVSIFAAWLGGFEIVYARVLLVPTNVMLSAIKKDTRIELVKNEHNIYQFKVRTRIEGRKASFPQPLGSLLQPFVIILSWQIFLLFALRFKSALKSAGVNLGIFMFIQAIFLILLTGYHTSETQKFIYIMMMDSFYIIALVLIIKDNLLYPVFRKEVNIEKPVSIKHPH